MISKVAIDSSMETSAFLSGSCFGGNYVPPAATLQPETVMPKVTKPLKKAFAPLRPVGTFQTPFAKVPVAAPQKQPAITRQYPPTKSQALVTTIFEDERSVPDDCYGLETATGMKVAPTTEALWAANW
jgi:hypothetical protein